MYKMQIGIGIIGSGVLVTLMSGFFFCITEDDAAISESDVTSSGKHNYCGDFECNYDELLRDYALESAGARIVDTGDTIEHVPHDNFMSKMLYSISSYLGGDCNGARTIIQPGSLPGECWAFKGSHGNVVIQLLGHINVTGVSIEHIPARIAPFGDITSAPRQFQLEGIEDATSRRAHNFGKFEYNKEGRPFQYFKVQPSKRHYNLVRVKFISNWGHREYTCVYRIRVHGGDLAPGNTCIT